MPMAHRLLGLLPGVSNVVCFFWDEGRMECRTQSDIFKVRFKPSSCKSPGQANTGEGGSLEVTISEGQQKLRREVPLG